MPSNDRRSRGFSPYTYNIQYARPGEGPNQQARPYVNMAIVPEEHLVIAKKSPDWLVYTVNTLIYSLDEDCLLHFDKAVTTMKVVSKSESLKEEKGSLSKIEPSIRSVEVSVSSAGSQLHEWTSSSKLTVKHSFSKMCDCVAFVGSRYAVCRKKMEEGRMELDFGDEFDYRQADGVRVVIYEIDDKASSLFRTKEVQNYNYDRLNSVLSFDNAFASTKCVPVVLDSDGYSYGCSYIDLTPSKVLIRADELGVVDKSLLESERAELMARVAEIQASYGTPPPPTGYLSGRDEEFTNVILPRVQEIDLTLRDMNASGMQYSSDISKIYEYTFSKSKDVTLQYGKSTGECRWSGNEVTVSHMMNGDVNFVLDDTLASNTGYEVSKVSDNEIKISFDSPEYAVCTLRLFLVKEAKQK